MGGGKCLESGTTNRMSADVSKIHQGSDVRKRISESDTKVSAIMDIMMNSVGILGYNPEG